MALNWRTVFPSVRVVTAFGSGVLITIVIVSISSMRNISKRLDALEPIAVVPSIRQDATIDVDESGKASKEFEFRLLSQTGQQYEIQGITVGCSCASATTDRPFVAADQVTRLLVTLQGEHQSEFGSQVTVDFVDKKIPPIVVAVHANISTYRPILRAQNGAIDLGDVVGDSNIVFSFSVREHPKSNPNVLAVVAKETGNKLPIKLIREYREYAEVTREYQCKFDTIKPDANQRFIWPFFLETTQGSLGPYYCLGRVAAPVQATPEVHTVLTSSSEAISRTFFLHSTAGKTIELERAEYDAKNILKFEKTKVEDSQWRVDLSLAPNSVPSKQKIRWFLRTPEPIEITSEIEWVDGALRAVN